MAKKSFKKNANLFRGESNPFNIKINRRKHPVLGLKVKGTKGLPGVSKAVSYAKRKELWQKSNIKAKKSNHYFDKRLLDPSMTLEDQVTARFVRERKKKAKKNIFNLNDDEELTHKGQPLQNLQNFDDIDYGSDEEEDKLAASFVSKAHFGGFTSEANFEKPKSHKELIEQLIIESKLKKQEKKIEKDKYINFQEMVDKEWREINLRSTINSNSILNPVQEVAKPEVVKPVATSLSRITDMYDLTKGELTFEPKGSSISHGKTPEQLLEEEKKLREKLEEERLLRMNETKNLKSVDHLSADGIYDYFDYLQPISTEVNNTQTSSYNEKEDHDSDESIHTLASSELSENEPMDEEDDVVSQNSCQIFFKEDNRDVSEIPIDIESFRTLVKDYNADQVYEVIDGMLKNTIRSKSEKVLVKLRKFFGILMQYALECCEGKFSHVDKTGILAPHLQSLASVSTISAAKIFLDILDQEQQIFQECKKQNMKRDFPRFQTLVVLKYSTVIFSASDFRHPVVTPAMIFMCDILSSPFNNTFINILSRLLVTKMVLDCITDSKRFLPEAIYFLNSVLQLAVPAKKGKDAKKKKFDLIVADKVSSDCILELDLLQPNKSLTTEDKIGIIFETVSQLYKFATLYTHLTSFSEIFSETLSISSKLPANYYPTMLQESLHLLLEFRHKNINRCQLSFQICKPKPLKLFEPSFESKFNKNNDINKKQKLLKSVSQKIKKEEKSMLREIRRDAQMIAAEKLKEKLESDAERKRKVKEIYGQLAMQEGEYKKMMKKKS